jgi:hypothetical protein
MIRFCRNVAAASAAAAASAEASAAPLGREAGRTRALAPAFTLTLALASTLVGCVTPREQRPAAPDVRGETAPLTNVEIEAVITSRLADMKTCFAGLLNVAEGARGVLTLRWIVGGDGHVTDVEVVESDFTGTVGEDLTRCLVPKVEALPFPRTRGGASLRITYPFVVK